MIRLKRFLFDYHLLVLMIGILSAGVWFAFFSVREREDLNLLLTILGGLISFFYFVQKQQLEELGHFKELFKYFNEKYDDLNEKLNEIAGADENKELAKEEIDTLYDYFNLCAEEYLYYAKGYIYPEVWTAWCNGMEFFLRDKRIQNLWANEDSASYYGLTPNEIRKYASRKYRISTDLN